MATLLLLTNAMTPSAEGLPALALLGHTVRVAPLEVSALLTSPQHDAVLVDARRDLAGARLGHPAAAHHRRDAPLFVVLTEGGLAALTSEWGVDDVLLDTGGPAEVEARLRLALGRKQDTAPPPTPGSCGPASSPSTRAPTPAGCAVACST
jgi:DNA-binding response OmpR family regulator